MKGPQTFEWTLMPVTHAQETCNLHVCHSDLQVYCTKQNKFYLMFLYKKRASNFWCKFLVQETCTRVHVSSTRFLHVCHQHKSRWTVGQRTKHVCGGRHSSMYLLSMSFLYTHRSVTEILSEYYYYYYSIPIRAKKIPIRFDSAIW